MMLTKRYRAVCSRSISFGVAHRLRRIRRADWYPAVLVVRSAHPRMPKGCNPMINACTLSPLQRFERALELLLFSLDCRPFLHPDRAAAIRAPESRDGFVHRACKMRPPPWSGPCASAHGTCPTRRQNGPAQARASFRDPKARRVLVAQKADEGALVPPLRHSGRGFYHLIKSFLGSFEIIAAAPAHAVVDSGAEFRRGRLIEPPLPDFVFSLTTLPFGFLAFFRQLNSLARSGLSVSAIATCGAAATHLISPARCKKRLGALVRPPQDQNGRPARQRAG
jgi:hypothetical protein